MEYFELHIDTSPKINRLNGRFLKNHVPHNKGKKWSDYMDMRKAKKVLKCLKLGRKGNDRLPGANRIPIVGIKDGKLYPFKSSVDAANILKSKGIKVNRRNICAVCLGKMVKNGKYSYIRKTAGGFQWFVAENVNEYKNLVF